MDLERSSLVTPRLVERSKAGVDINGRALYVFIKRMGCFCFPRIYFGSFFIFFASWFHTSSLLSCYSSSFFFFFLFLVSSVYLLFFIWFCFFSFHFFYVSSYLAFVMSVLHTCMENSVLFSSFSSLGRRVILASVCLSINFGASQFCSSLLVVPRMYSTATYPYIYPPCR